MATFIDSFRNFSNGNQQNLSFDQKIRIALQFNNLSKETKQVLTKVYSTLAMALCVATMGVYTAIKIYRPNIFLTFLLNIGSVLYFVFTPKQDMNKRFALLGVISFISGLNLSDLIGFYIHINPALVLSAFMLTSGIFVSFTLFSLLTDKRTFLFLGSTLVSLSLGLMVLSFYKLFGGSNPVLDQLFTLGILASSVLFVIYDTQMIVYRIENGGDKDFIRHSLVLFLDFIDLFRIILITLAKKDERDRNNERRKRR